MKTPAASWMNRAIDSTVDALAAIAFPQGCHVCGGAVSRRADGVACGACWSNPETTLLFAGRSGCERCGMPGSNRCASCPEADIPIVRSAGLWSGALRAALLDLKRRPRVCRRLGDLMAETYRFEQSLHGVDLVIPVPLHPDRLAERGHNQAALLAEPVAREAAVEIELRGLSRVRLAERKRAGVDRVEREEAARSAFRASAGLVSGRSILLVDDVLTSGATLAACTLVLAEAGATSVRAITAARAAQ